MKLQAILIGTNSQRIEQHELIVPNGLRVQDITAARDLLIKRARERGLRPAPGYTYTRGEVRVWAEAA